MTDTHPITPPPELVQEWATAHGTNYQDLAALCMRVATGAAQWGWDQRGTEIQAVTDQELEACVKWLEWNHSDLLSRDLRAARRPESKPPSLKERALEAMHRNWNPHNNDDFATIARALEQLPE